MWLLPLVHDSHLVSVTPPPTPASRLVVTQEIIKVLTSWQLGVCHMIPHFVLRSDVVLLQSICVEVFLCFCF